MSAKVRDGLTVACVAVYICFTLGASNAAAQGCYTRTTNGGTSTVNIVAAVPLIGTDIANTNARENDAADSSYYQLSTFYGPTSVVVATALVSGPIADNDHAPFGVTFINGTTGAVTVTQVDIRSDLAHAPLFRLSPKPTNIDPLSGTWDMIDTRTARWTGSLVIPSKSAQGFIADVYVSNVGVNVNGVIVDGLITTSAGLFPAAGFPTDLFVPNGSNKVATAVVGFIDAGSFPRTIVNATPGPAPPANLIGGQPSIISARVQEFANNQSIAAGLAMTITVPPQFSNLSVFSAPAPWNAAGATIVQPTSSTAGSVTIRTTAVIGKGNFSPIVQIQVTPPVVYTKSTFQMRAALDGFDTSAGSQGAHPIRSVCDGGGTILPSAADAAKVINVEFLSPRLNASPTSVPVGSVDLRTDFNVVNNVGGETIRVDVMNFTTGLWDTLAPTPVVPGSSDYTLTASLSGADYIDASSRMNVRYVSSTAAPMTLRIDYLTWIAQLFWVVDNAVGSDANPGSAKSPFATISRATTAVGPSEQVRVLVGQSQAGTPYAGNLMISAPGTAVCKTLFQGIPSGGLLPAVRAAVAASDWGIEADANHVKVDSFQIDNANIGLGAGAVTGTVFSNNIIRVPDVSAGIVLDRSTDSTVLNNAISLAAGGPLFGISDSLTTNSLLDGNRVTGLTTALGGIFVNRSSAARIQRNILTGNNTGIYLARTAGTTLVYNNTVDSNTLRGINAESTGSVTSRNNIVTRNPLNWVSNLPGAVSSDFDDVFGAGAPSQNYVGVTPGVNSISANPMLDVNSRPTAGSPCIDAGTNVGLPFLGLRPDIGAFEQ